MNLIYTIISIQHKIVQLKSSNFLLVLAPIWFVLFIHAVFSIQHLLIAITFILQFTWQKQPLITLSSTSATHMLLPITQCKIHFCLYIPVPHIGLNIFIMQFLLKTIHIHNLTSFLLLDDSNDHKDPKYHLNFIHIALCNNIDILAHIHILRHCFRNHETNQPLSISDVCLSSNTLLKHEFT